MRKGTCVIHETIRWFSRCCSKRHSTYVYSRVPRRTHIAFLIMRLIEWSDIFQLLTKRSDVFCDINLWTWPLDTHDYVGMSIKTTNSVRVTAGVGRYWAPSQKKNQKFRRAAVKEKLFVLWLEKQQADQHCDRFSHCVPDIAGIMNSTFVHSSSYSYYVYFLIIY